MLLDTLSEKDRMEVIALCGRLWMLLLIAHVQKSYSEISYSPFSIIPSRLQLFEYESVSFTCEGFNISAGWKVRSTQQVLSKCFNSPVTKTCGIKYAFATDSGKYWCESGAERSNTVSITVSAGAVILESPVHPVMEGDAVILHCRNKTEKQDSNFTADFYKDSLPMGTSYDGKLEIQNASKSHEGFYKCKIHGVGKSPESWLAIRRKSNAEDGGAVTLKNSADSATEVLSVFPLSHKEISSSHIYYTLLWVVLAAVLALQFLVLGLLYWKMKLVLLQIKMNDQNKEQCGVAPNLKRDTETAADNFSLETNKVTNPQTQKDKGEPSCHTLHSTFIDNNTLQPLYDSVDSGECSFMVRTTLSDPPLTPQECQYSAIKW
ncbi:uncharacterized protein LOC120434170 isoform X2 [Oreochromis aureus]|uniref:uncharacterized protein LOC120434170 isoform X2 n=1 Tax=Oreochromis aureus TaxID=47969 RepID=UPI001954798C|nr:uncharacterized protein LOC120434170 isoform X2 [Oreochromis aureus]